MTKTSKKLLILLGIALFIFVMANMDNWFGRRLGEYNHPTYVYTYSEEYHRQKISERTQEIFEEELSSGKIVNFEIETVYSFYDNDPEYFLITFKYADEFDVIIKDEITGYKTKYKYLIGYHHGKGEYYTGLSCFMGEAKNALRYGISPWDYLGYENSKKYYGCSDFGVEEDGGIYKIYSLSFDSYIEREIERGETESWRFKKILMNKKDQKKLMADFMSYRKRIY